MSGPGAGDAVKKKKPTQTVSTYYGGEEQPRYTTTEPISEHEEWAQQAAATRANQERVAKLISDSYHYGGHRQPYYEGIATEVEARQSQAPQYWAADAARSQGLQSRRSLEDALALYRSGASQPVSQPSVADASFRQYLDEAARNQASAVAATRGGAMAMASAQRQAATQANQQGLQAMGQAALMRIQEQQRARDEMMQNRAAYAQLAGAMRGQDLAQQVQDAQQSSFVAQLAAQQQQARDQLALGYRGMGSRAEEIAMQGRSSWANALLGQQQQNAALQAQIGASDNARFDRYLAAGLTILSTLGGALVGGPGGAVLGGALGAGAGTLASSR